MKALLPGRGDLLPRARVGSWLVACAFLAFGGCEKNELIKEAKVAGNTTADFPQIAAGGNDDG